MKSIDQVSFGFSGTAKASGWTACVDIRVFKTGGEDYRNFAEADRVEAGGFNQFVEIKLKSKKPALSATMGKSLIPKRGIIWGTLEAKANYHLKQLVAKISGGDKGSNFELWPSKARLRFGRSGRPVGGATHREAQYGGETGIRTLETVSRLHTFQACAFDHSATSPLGACIPAFVLFARGHWRLSIFRCR